ncbi:MAG TPA: hypothetical protein VHY30_07975 [Verrucomicrobiae bacterium]|nr:hypothetical protein [Verrucomicrobiae bacterium]
MKTSNFHKLFLVIVAVGLALSTMTVVAQNSPASAAPQLAYGVPQILQLAQAKVSDDTIIAYIRNSGNSYGLDANQIIYLRQQGISDNVINFMLNQPKVASAPTQPATQPDNSSVAQTSTTYAPPPTYVQSAPPSTVYVIPNTQAYYNNYYAQPYYYPYYGWSYPAVSLSFGFGGRWGGGFHGGGFHGGGWHR